jgi:hypothetical protein
MSLIVADRVKETTTTTGTGALTLGGAVAGFRAFADVCSNGDTVHYCIAHRTPGEWEVGVGTWATGGTLARTTVLASSNAGALVSFAAGTKDVFLTENAGTIGSRIELDAALPRVKRSRVDLTETQIRNLFSTPVELVAAEAGVAHIPDFMSYCRDAGTAYTQGSATNILLRMNAVSYDAFGVNTLLTGPGPYRRLTVDVNGGASPYGAFGVIGPSRDDTNKNVTISIAGGNVSGGSGGLSVVLFYRSWPVTQFD